MGEDADQISCILIAEQHQEGRRSVSAQPDGWQQISSASKDECVELMEARLCISCFASP